IGCRIERQYSAVCRAAPQAAANHDQENGGPTNDTSHVPSPPKPHGSVVASVRFFSARLFGAGDNRCIRLPTGCSPLLANRWPSKLPCIERHSSTPMYSPPRHLLQKY